MFTYDAIVSRGYEESMTQALGTKFTQDGSKFEQTAPRGAQTQNFYTCSGRFPAITTIKDIHPHCSIWRMVLGWFCDGIALF